MSAILVIDDDPVTTKLLELTFQPGHQVHIARDMASGRRALEDGGHDVLILDIFLPDGSGWEILKYLRNELHLTLPVFVLTGHRQDGFAKRAIELGADGYVTKPFSPRELLTQIDRLAG